MNTLLTVLACTSLVGLTMLIRAFRYAPEGYEDERGFHNLSQNETAADVKPVETRALLDDLLVLDKQMASQPWR